MADGTETEGASEFMVINAPQGELVTVGVLEGSKIQIERPEGRLVGHDMTQAAIVGLALHGRIVELEARLAKLEGAQ